MKLDIPRILYLTSQRLAWAWLRFTEQGFRRRSPRPKQRRDQVRRIQEARAWMTAAPSSGKKQPPKRLHQGNHAAPEFMAKVN